MNTSAIMIFLGVPLLAAEPTPTDGIISRMMERNAARQDALRTYSVVVRYSLHNKSHSGAMVVRWTYRPNQAKTYQILSEECEPGVRNRVFSKLLESEVESSIPSQRDRTRISPANYSFRFVDEEVLNGRNTYVFEIDPRVSSKYQTRGRIWVDAADMAIVQLSGSPAQNPSFWTKRVDYVQRFSKHGDFYLADSNHVTSDVRVFGLAELSVEYVEYEFAGTHVIAGL